MSAAQTSIAAYQDLDPERMMSQKARILHEIRTRGPLCNRELALLMNLPESRISARTNALVHKDKRLRLHAIEGRGEKGKDVEVWELVR